MPCENFLHRLAIFLWAAVHNDIRYCYFKSPIGFRFERYIWQHSTPAYPWIRISLTIQRPGLYLPSEVKTAYERRNWTDKHWAAYRELDDIPF